MGIPCPLRGSVRLLIVDSPLLADENRWFWPIPLIVAAILAPDSPWWLVRQNRLEDAKKSLRRLTSRGIDFDLDKSVALMAVTTEHEREVASGTHFLACFRGTDLRRTIIVIGCYCMQVFSGSTLRAYMTYFFQQAGLPTDQAFNMSIVGYALGFTGVVFSVSLELLFRSKDSLLIRPFCSGS